MKEEARFQIRGEVTGLLDETYKESVRFSLVLRVALWQDKKAWFKVEVKGEELCRVARACKGRHVLVIGRMSGGQSPSGYYNAYLSADAILVEPAAAPAELRRGKPAAYATSGGAGVAEPAPAHTPRQQAKASPQHMPHEDDADIPF